jgi:hypothetical protein
VRSVVIHYHIFKNAGTSIDRLLHDAFGDSWATFEGTDPNQILNSEQLAAFLTSRPDVRAVSSHQARPPLPAGFDAVPIVFIRHPLDRVESVYEFVRRDPSQPSHELLRRLSLSEYVSWVLQEGPGAVIVRNYQTIHLANASFRAPHIYDAKAAEDDLQEAIAFLRSIPVVGLVERFADSIGLLSRHISEKIMPVRFEECRENVSAGRTGDLEERLEKLRRCVTRSQWEALIEANRFDLELYTFAEKTLKVQALSLTNREF